ncbi:MAG: response regulator [Acidobacteria bacterium]|nr:response regulator [Acidobacteriota bacterium]
MAPDLGPIPPEFAGAPEVEKEDSSAAVEGRGDSVLVLEITGRGLPVIADLNEAAARAHGYARSELLGQPITVIDPDMTPELGAERSRWLGEHPGRPMHVRHRRKDGSFFEVEVLAHQVEFGGRVFSVALERDTTERMREENAIRLREQRFREAQTLARLGHWEYHHKDGWTFWSEELHRIHEHDPRRPPPSYEAFLSIVHPEDRRSVQEAYDSHLASGSPYAIEYRLILPSGKVRHIRSHCRTEFEGPAMPLRTFGTDQDITERKEEAEARRALEQQLQHLQRLEVVGRLAGGVAHDMNNVLAAILAMATQLHQAGGAARGKAELILKACLRGRNLVKGLLDFSRKAPERQEILDLHEILTDEAELLSGTTLGRIQIVLDLQAEPSLILGDANAVANALMNLGVNAVDAMPGGGELALRTRSGAGGMIEILVEDSGQGMPPEVLDRAIEPFFTTKPSGKGTGLGLSAVFGTARAHGGNLEIQSEVGRGTRVILRLPAISEVEPSRAGNSIEPGGRPARAWRILLVDDDDLIRETAPAMLASAGHWVQAAASGRQALALLEAGLEVDAVVLDLNMPGMDGGEALGAIRALRPGLPVLMASGYLGHENLDPFLSLGKVQVLAKPYSLDEFHRTLERL